MADAETLNGRLERVRKADLPNRDLDGDLWESAVSKLWRYPLSGPWVDTPHYPVPCITASIDAARTAHAKVLPNLRMDGETVRQSFRRDHGRDDQRSRLDFDRSGQAGARRCDWRRGRGGGHPCR